MNVQDLARRVVKPEQTVAELLQVPLLTGAWYVSAAGNSKTILYTMKSRGAVARIVNRATPNCGV